MAQLGWHSKLVLEASQHPGSPRDMFLIAAPYAWFAHEGDPTYSSFIVEDPHTVEESCRLCEIMSLLVGVRHLEPHPT